MSLDHLKISHTALLRALFESVAHDRVRKRMIRAFFERQRERQQLLRVHAPGLHIGHDRTAFRDRAGLVHDGARDVMQVFKCFSRLEQHAVFRADTRADHDRDRSREAERTRAGDHENRNRAGQCERGGLPCQQPDDRSHERDTHDDRHENTGNLVRELGDRRLGCTGLLDQTDDLAERGVITDARCTHHEIAALGNRRADDCTADMALNRHALSGDRALVEKRAAFGDHAVHRHRLTAANDHEISRLHLLDRQLNGPAAADDLCGLRAQIHQRRNGLAGLALSSRLEELAKHEAVRRLGRMHEAVRRLGRRCGADADERINTVDERRARADRDQCVHRWRAMQQGLKAVDIVFTVDEDDGDRQDKLGQRERKHAVHAGGIRRQRQSDHLSHGKIHENDHKYSRYDDALFHLAQRLICLCALRRR